MIQEKKKECIINVPFTLLHWERQFWSYIFHDNNGFHENNGHLKIFVDFCIKIYLKKVFTKKEVAVKASKNELICVSFFCWKKVVATEYSFGLLDEK